MLFVLGLGSNTGMSSVIMTCIRDRIPGIKHWLVAFLIALFGFTIGCVYCTPGGQYLLNLLDFYGASFVAFTLAIAELIGIGWIYGVDRFCSDIEFMLNIKTGWYYRICWAVVSPIFMIGILIYTIIEMEPIKYRDYIYPDIAYVLGWILSAIGILQLPFWTIYACYKQKGNSWTEKFIKCFKPTRNWGPIDPVMQENYQDFRKQLKLTQKLKNRKNLGIFERIKLNIFGSD